MKLYKVKELLCYAASRYGLEQLPGDESSQPKFAVNKEWAAMIPRHASLYHCYGTLSVWTDATQTTNMEPIYADVENPSIELTTPHEGIKIRIYDVTHYTRVAAPREDCEKAIVTTLSA